MTYKEICQKLRESGIDNYGYDAAVLIEELEGTDVATLRGDPNRDYCSEKLMDAIDKRCKHYPLQYIIGEWEFFGKKFEVSESCLIPRADTETLVETAIKLLPRNAYFADLCTGSGCIAIATLANRPDCRAYAAELYEETLRIAEKNAKKNQVDGRLEFGIADVLCPDCLDGVCKEGNERFDAILSNPPYIPSQDIDSLADEVRFEPRAALDGGGDGLIFYRTITSYSKKYLKEGGIVIFEIGYDQADSLRKIAEENQFSCEIIRDLGQRDRVAVLRAETQK